MTYTNKWGFNSNLRGIDDDTAIPYTDVYGAFGEPDSSWYQHVAEIFNSGSVFVEIGSFEGRSAVCLAESIFRLDKQITLHCVDTFTGNPEQDEYDYLTNNPDCLYNKFNENTAFYQKRNIIVPHRGYSNTVCDEFEDNSIDFVFIDARHEYEFVMEDIKCWYPKLRSGGIMAGHDYRNNFVNISSDVLAQAIEAFCKLKNIKYSLSGPNGIEYTIEEFCKNNNISYSLPTVPDPNGYGVDRAVKEFCQENDIKYSLLDPSSASTIFIMDRKK
jgi:hypothetical protein